MFFKRYLTSILAVTFAIVMGIGNFVTSSAYGKGYPWKDHAPPYDFMFGNDIDPHQQTQLKNSGELFGFLYVTDTGNEIDGVKIVEHCNENTPEDLCVVGWIIRGKYLGEGNKPTLVYREGRDHPTWLLVSRNDIPQPGTYVHFHWIDGPESDGGLVVGDTYDGFIIEFEAVDMFYFRHNDEYLRIMPGVDARTHVNIVGSFPGY